MRRKVQKYIDSSIVDAAFEVVKHLGESYTSGCSGNRKQVYQDDIIAIVYDLEGDTLIVQEIDDDSRFLALHLIGEEIVSYHWGQWEDHLLNYLLPMIDEE